MTATQIEIRTADGVAEGYVHRPAGAGPWPGAVLFPDAFGVRPATQEMAARLAAGGYLVLLPDVLYRDKGFAPFDAKAVWSDPAERDRLMAMLKKLDTAAAGRDAAAYLDALAAQPGVRPGPAGLVGYCMGGRMAFVAAAAHPTRVGAAAPIHAGGLVTDAPDSPHLLANRIKARLYLGVADNDRSCTPEQQAQLKAALDAAGVRYQLEVYPGAMHGFAVPDAPVFNPAAAERHWERVLALFGEALPRG